MGDTQNDSIRSLNFGKNGINSISDSIQTFIQLKKIGDDSTQLTIQFKYRVIINYVESEKFPRNAQNVSKIEKRGVFIQNCKFWYMIRF